MQSFTMTRELEEVIELSRQISIDFKHYFIHTHHLLAAMLRSECLASAYLQDVDVHKWDDRLRKDLAPDTEGYADEGLPLTEEVDNVLTHAEALASLRDTGAISSVDILIVLLAYRNPVKEFINKTGVLMQEVLSQHYGPQASLPELPLAWEETDLTQIWSMTSEPDRQEIRERILEVATIFETYGRYQDMHTLCHIMLAVEPDNPDCLYDCALASFLQRDFDKAVPILKRLSDLPEYEIGCNSMLSVISSQNGDHTLAISEAEKNLALNPESVNDLNNLGYYLSKQSQYEQAELHLNKAMQLDAEEPYVRNNLGYVLYKLGHVQEGIAAIIQSLTFDKSNYNAYYNLGLIYMETGDKDKARQYLENALYYHNDPLYDNERQEIAALLKQLA